MAARSQQTPPPGSGCRSTPVQQSCSAAGRRHPRARWHGHGNTSAANEEDFLFLLSSGYHHLSFRCCKVYYKFLSDVQNRKSTVRLDYPGSGGCRSHADSLILIRLLSFKWSDAHSRCATSPLVGSELAPCPCSRSSLQSPVEQTHRSPRWCFQKGTSERKEESTGLGKEEATRKGTRWRVRERPKMCWQAG